MKKILYILPLVLLIGCTKTTDTDPESVLVRFNVSSLDVDVQPMTKASSIATSSLTTIQYHLRNTQTFKEYTGTQLKSVAGDDFGKIDLLLAPGYYAAKFTAFSGDNDGSVVAMDTKNDRIVMDNRDLFFVDTDADVKAGSNNFSIVMNRIVGKLNIHFNDVFSDYGSVKISISGLNISRSLSTSSLSTVTKDVAETLTIDSDGVCPDFTIYAFPQTITIGIKLLDKSGVEVASMTKTVDVYANRKTVVSGNLLDVLKGSEFTIQINDDWGADNEVGLTD